MQRDDDPYCDTQDDCYYRAGGAPVVGVVVGTVVLGRRLPSRCSCTTTCIPTQQTAISSTDLPLLSRQLFARTMPSPSKGARLKHNITTTRTPTMHRTTPHRTMPQRKALQGAASISGSDAVEATVMLNDCGFSDPVLPPESSATTTCIPMQHRTTPRRTTSTAVVMPWRSTLPCRTMEFPSPR